MKKKQADSAGIKLIQYTNERFDSLQTVLEKDMAALDQEDFHRARVDIKKIKSVTRIVKFNDHRFRRKKFLTRINRLFSVAGAIREAQLELEVIVKLKLESAVKCYTRRTARHIVSQKNKFAKAKRNVQKKFYDDLKSLAGKTRNVNIATTESYISGLQDQLVSLLNKEGRNASDVHQLRKKLKELMYAVNIFKADEVETKRVDRLQDLLGKWHDKAVMAKHLEDQQLAGKIITGESVKLAALSARIQRAANRIYQKIINEIDQLKSGSDLLPAKGRKQISPE